MQEHDAEDGTGDDSSVASMHAPMLSPPITCFEQTQLDAATEIAMACAQRTAPLGANCAMLASSALDLELKQQQIPERNSKDLMEGLAHVRRMLYHGTQVRDNQDDAKTTPLNVLMWCRSSCNTSAAGFSPALRGNQPDGTA